MPRADLYDPKCPSRRILQLIGGKWSMLLLCTLRSGPVRTGALRRTIGGVSQKMLTQTLRELERHGLVQPFPHTMLRYVTAYSTLSRRPPALGNRRWIFQSATLYLEESNLEALAVSMPGLQPLT